MVDWPSSVGFSTEWEDYAEDLTLSVLHGGEAQHAPNLEEYDAGDSRVTYDVSHVTDVPAVLKIAYETRGITETENEVVGRKSVSPPLRDHLVPIYNYGHGFAWSVQPKCDAVPATEVEDAVAFLSTLAEDAGLGTAEIYGRNVGTWNGQYVVYDYGGLFN